MTTPPTDPLVRKEPPLDWYRTPSEAGPRVETADRLPDLDPDIALWPVTPMQRWPFTGAPSVGIWPKGWTGVDNTGTTWVCTVGGQPGTWAQVGGGSGITAWGQESTAKFAGSGSPSGVVTPSHKGDLYVDDTTPALYQATGVADTDWQQVGTSVQMVVAMLGLSPNAGPNLGVDISVPCVSGALTYLGVTTTLQTVPSGAGNGFGIIFAAPTFASGTFEVDGAVLLQISNQAGTQKIQLDLAGSSIPLTSGETWEPDLTTFSTSDVVGSDLTVTAGSVDSTAGGQFQASLTIPVLYTAA